MDRGAWWAAVHRVTQSWTRLKRLSMLACIGEGNGNPLQYSCLEDPRDRGDRWAAVYGVAQSRRRLKRCRSSSSSIPYLRLLMFLPAILIPAYNSSSPTFFMMCSVYKLNKHGDNKQPRCTPSSILNQSVVPHKVLTVAS